MPARTIVCLLHFLAWAARQPDSLGMVRRILDGYPGAGRRRDRTTSIPQSLSVF